MTTPCPITTSPFQYRNINLTEKLKLRNGVSVKDLLASTPKHHGHDFSIPKCTQPGTGQRGEPPTNSPGTHRLKCFRTVIVRSEHKPIHIRNSKQKPVCIHSVIGLVARPKCGVSPPGNPMCKQIGYGDQATKRNTPLQ